MDHPLKTLRESAACTQLEIANRTGISSSRLSLAENFLTSLTPKEEDSVRAAILAATDLYRIIRTTEILRKIQKIASSN
jgi:transcriptional regulator with XRE-family HTH domain